MSNQLIQKEYKKKLKLINYYNKKIDPTTEKSEDFLKVRLSTMLQEGTLEDVKAVLFQIEDVGLQDKIPDYKRAQNIIKSAVNPWVLFIGATGIVFGLIVDDSIHIISSYIRRKKYGFNSVDNLNNVISIFIK